jgi:hypothetical protein
VLLEGVPVLEVADGNLIGVFELPSRRAAEGSVREALGEPIGAPRLRDMAAGKESVLIVVDDVSRPTPAWEIVPHVLDELAAAGVADSGIEFVMALGTHRPMTGDEMRAKVGADVYARFRCHNHAWDDLLSWIALNSRYRPSADPTLPSLCPYHHTSCRETGAWVILEPSECQQDGSTEDPALPP